MAGMTDIADIIRTAPPMTGGERELLEAWLEFHRATLALKCRGLDDGQLRRRSVEPSGLSLLGLVRHMAEVERHWFRGVLAGEEFDGGIYWTREQPDGDFDDVDTADTAEAFATWRAECEAARAAAAGLPLDTVGRRLRHGSEVSLRWILIHMIEEYARHNGHADLIRERIDGATGD
jgi:uncharacterized damage-inducible protein DinB